MAMLEQVWRSRPDVLAAQLDPIFQRYRHSRLLAKVWRDVLYSDQTRHIVTTQPQIGKTTVCSRWGPAWALDQDPTLNIMLLSNAMRLARTNARAARNILRDHRRNLRTHLAPDQTAADYWVTPEGGSVLAAGVDGQIVGMPGAVIVVDDPHKNRREANSQLRRDAVWDWWTDDVLSRLQGTPRMLVVMTRWHPDDLVGRLLETEPDLWQVTHLPAIADPAIQPDGDPLGREPGEVVCPERFDLEAMLARQRSVGPVTWASLYQGVPTLPEGEIIKRDWWAIEPTPIGAHMFDLFVTSWDLTFDDTGESWTVGQLWGKTRGADGRPHFWCLDETRGQWDFPTQRRAIVAFDDKATHAGMAPAFHLVERAANGAAMLKELASWGRSKLVGISPSGRGSKLDRAIAITGMMADGQIHVPGWLDDGGIRRDGTFRESWVDHLINEAANFRGEKGEINDRVDAMTQAVSWLAAPTGGQIISDTGLGTTRPR